MAQEVLKMPDIDRRSLLKTVAIAGGGLAAAALGATEAVAADPTAPPTTQPRGEAGPLLATTPGYRYKYLTGAQAFVPQNSTQTYLAGTLDGSSFYKTGGLVSLYAYAPFNLPHGAVIQEILWSAIRNDANAQTLWFYVHTPSTGIDSVIVSTAVPGISSSIQNVAQDLSAVPAASRIVDTSQNTYNLYWGAATGTNHILEGVRIGYTQIVGEAKFLPTPVRVADTRGSSQIGPVLGPLQPGNTYDFPIAGANGIPAEAISVFGNLTAVDFHDGYGYMTIYPAGASTPLASNINFGFNEPNQLANFFQVKLGTGGKARIYVSGAPTNAILDISGYVV